MRKWKMKNKFIKIIQLGDPHTVHINVKTICVMCTINSDQLYIGCEGGNQATLSFKNEDERNKIFDIIYERCLFYLYNLLIKVYQPTSSNKYLYAISKNKICTMGEPAIDELYIGCKGNNYFNLSFDNEKEREDFINKILKE